MKLRKDILEKALESFNSKEKKNYSIAQFSKLVASGLKMIQEEEKEQEQGFFISHVRTSEEWKQFYAGVEYKNELEIEEYNDEEEYKWDEDEPQAN